ncbi:MAG: hypothetical protein MUP66_00840 [Candidatus Nanohaloarchaeota archaeon QJJ-5]|nr:hypothetical protein [Candidatus Nanohaloarchaeota archaeon QJJ-5]
MKTVPVTIQIDLSDRELRIGTTSITLSNHQIQQLRSIKSTSFDNKTAKKAVKELLTHQIIPFIEMTDRNPDSSQIQKEVAEAFGTHLYLYTHSTTIAEQAE